MKVDGYCFGSMDVGGHTYTRDLIVFPHKVISGWWRKEGHLLGVEDLCQVLQFNPEVLVVGTGAYGFMAIAEPVSAILKERGIELFAAATPKAYKVFNEHIQAGRKVVGAFHLTC